MASSRACTSLSQRHQVPGRSGSKAPPHGRMSCAEHVPRSADKGLCSTSRLPQACYAVWYAAYRDARGFACFESLMQLARDSARARVLFLHPGRSMIQRERRKHMAEDIGFEPTACAAFFEASWRLSCVQLALPSQACDRHAGCPGGLSGLAFSASWPMGVRPVYAQACQELGASGWYSNPARGGGHADHTTPADDSSGREHRRAAATRHPESLPRSHSLGRRPAHPLVGDDPASGSPPSSSRCPARHASPG